ncbi:glycosyltransferase family 1 protein [Calocera cornea HHB12733]|uniref:Glycosyltransferase family 1 protein n=1 Tax=Calocera cornea HHB12733 TaxID=1353952 RepID=A0A165FFI7_9BASI|nr:glycosyltransferase family 1 protein [Calocera cornea HHB12733]
MRRSPASYCSHSSTCCTYQVEHFLLPLRQDAEGTDGVKEWFCANTSRPVFSLGPQLPASYLNAKGGDRFEEPPTSRSEVRISYFNSQETAGDKSDTSIIFLNNALKKYGAKSVLYITFGSLMVPELARVGYLLDVLLELEEPMPFLFTTASTAMHISDSIREKVATTGRGLLVPWAPQQAVLEHPATGWAVSHCGAGGITESLAQGIPLIAWPVGAEQPSNARWVSEVLDTAFELLQVRARLGHNKAFRGGPNGTEIVGTEEAIKAEMKDVLTRARGEEGRRKRANAGKVQQLIREALVPGGQVDEHFELLNKEIM